MQQSLNVRLRVEESVHLFLPTSESQVQRERGFHSRKFCSTKSSESVGQNLEVCSVSFLFCSLGSFVSHHDSWCDSTLTLFSPSKDIIVTRDLRHSSIHESEMCCRKHARRRLKWILHSFFSFTFRLLMFLLLHLTVSSSWVTWILLFHCQMTRGEERCFSILSVKWNRLDSMWKQFDSSRRNSCLEILFHYFPFSWRFFTSSPDFRRIVLL